MHLKLSKQENKSVPIFVILILLCAGVIAILLGSCNRETGVPGGQAAARSVGAGGVLERQPIEILMDGKPHGIFRWQELEGLQEAEFGTGLDDVQKGYPLVDVLARLEIREAKAVTLYGPGLKPVTLRWDEIVNRENKILMGLTHKGTVKVVAGNPAVLNRDGWVRHLLKMDVLQQDFPDTRPEGEDGRIAEPDVNPLHPRKKGSK
jgi:hypothetical protein